jgi:hypothetical protein
MLDCVTGENRDVRREDREIEEQRWELASPVFAGEISSEETPGPATGLLLHVAASPKRRPRAIPRIWTPADAIAGMVPQSPVEAAETPAPRKMGRRSRERAISRAKEDVSRLLRVSSTCSICGKRIVVGGLFADRPVAIGPVDDRKLACRGCVFDGRHASQLDLAGVGVVEGRCDDGE